MVPEVSIGVDGPKKCRIWKIHYFETFGPTPNNKEKVHVGTP